MLNKNVTETIVIKLRSRRVRLFHQGGFLIRKKKIRLNTLCKLIGYINKVLNINSGFKLRLKAKIVCYTLNNGTIAQ